MRAAADAAERKLIEKMGGRGGKVSARPKKGAAKARATPVRVGRRQPPPRILPGLVAVERRLATAVRGGLARFGAGCRRLWWRLGRRWRIAGLVALGLAAVLVTADQAGVEFGFSRAVTAFDVAVGFEPKEDETFTECLKGATEGAFSTAVPVAEIVVAGELALASPVLVAAGAGLGCSLGTLNSLASAGAGWTVHTVVGIWEGLLGM